MSRILLLASDASVVHTRRWGEWFHDSGWEVIVASFVDAPIPGAEVHVLEGGTRSALARARAARHLRRLVRAVGPNVVNAHYLTTYGAIAAKAGVEPLVVTAWGPDVLTEPASSPHLLAAARNAIRRAQAVTTVAAHMEDAVVALGARPEDVTSVPFGVDTELFVRRLRMGRTGSLRIISTRALEPVYDVETIVRAFHLLAGGGHHLRLDIVGDGSQRPMLESLVDVLGLRGLVTFHGRIEQEPLVDRLNDAAVFVSAAHSDGNNICLNEAMACGCFPVVTKIPANEQWIRHGTNGLLFEPGDVAGLAAAILSAIDDRQLRLDAASLNTGIVASRANWKVATAQMMRVFDRVDTRGRAPLGSFGN